LNPRALKILLLAKSSSFHTERFAAELRRQGCRVLLASLERGHPLHFHLKRRGPHHYIHYLMAPLEIRQLINRFRPDVVNSHFASDYGVVTRLATLGARVPVVLNIWGSDVLVLPRKSFLHKMKSALALKAADCVIGDSQYLVSAAEELAPLQSKRVIPWGIERRHLAFHKQCYAFQNPLRVIIPRTQEKLYNNEFVVRSLVPLIREGKVEITFTNFGSLADAFRRQTLDVTGDKGVRFYDEMSREKFLPFMAEHDIYLSASTTDSSPVSLIEAMALGLLPIAADIPGVREWLTPESGYLFRPYDPESLRRLVLELLDQKNPRAEMRKKNLERVKLEAIFENNVAEEISIMKELSGWSRR
jgi:glycosyltransferase involved in cell wall biosynthesis